MKYYMNTRIFLLFLAFIAIGAPLSFAQDAANAPGAQPADAAQEEVTEPPIRFDSPYDYFDQSLMFTESEILKIQAALTGLENEAIEGVSNEDPTSEELSVPENRFIRLGGIAFTTPDRWMIWINGQRVTPNNMLPEIVEIQVHKDYVDLKWFDELLRKIIKIRLRPNWAYEIRTGVLIPG